MDTKNHEEQRTFQETSFNYVKALVSSIEELGNPCSEESEDLLVLNTKEIGSPEAVRTLQEIREIGQKQCDRNA